MLLRFGAENLWSIKTYQEMSLIASKLSDDNSDLISLPHSDEKVLSAAGIYGANASGKSNVLNSLRLLRSAVVRSFKAGSATGGTPRVPFALDASQRNKPSRLDCDFVVADVRYHFGFTFDNERILEEWLYAFPRGRRQIWFVRSEKGPIHFGKMFVGRNRIIEDLTRPNSLFLSTAAQNNHEMITPIYSYFSDSIVFSEGGTGEFELLLDPALKKRLLEFVSNADVGIGDLVIDSTPPPEGSDEFVTDLRSLLAKHKIEIGNDVPKRLKVGHRSADGEFVYFDLHEESRGTIALLRMLGPMFEALRTGKTIVIDEIDTSLHPILTIKVIELFGKGKLNEKGGQLIFSTHDTNILCSGALRRDQIWFTEKKSDGGTVLYPLSDISTRKTDNIEKGYLQGRFGAIPFLGRLDSLYNLWRNEDHGADLSVSSG